jgi:hypothetical protein
MNSEGYEGAPDGEHPRERTQFKQLLLANHFSELGKAEHPGPPKGNTSYEELVCIGYQPQLKRLDAVVHLKQAGGYSGGICSAGSQEYVKFFASTDGGATWTELGTAAFTARDVPGTKPLEFDVTLPVDLHEMCCKDENVVLIRGILSWQVAPGDFDDPVVWGNGLDVHIQVAPKQLGTLLEWITCHGLQIEDAPNLQQVVELGDPQELSAIELHKLYKASKVPQHRYLFSHVAQLLDDPVALTQMVKTPGAALVPGISDEIDLGPIISIFLDPQGNQTFEQLGCVGLNASRNELVATIDIKRPTGYSGNLCSKGSKEHVAFWADWGTGYEYVGTTAVDVHDIASIPGDGLRYSAVMPFPQALTRRRPCTKGPVTPRIRAVLSWAIPPSDTNPFAVPHWGGHLETHVLLTPGVPSKAGPMLESIGSMAVSKISDATGLANGASELGFLASQRPFGGSLKFTGHVVNPVGSYGGSGYQYRILISKDAGTSFTPMLDPFDITKTYIGSTVQTPMTQTPDPAGWCPYITDIAAGFDVVENVLGYSTTSGNGQVWIAMEARDGGGALGVRTPWELVQLDNEAPVADIQITSGGGSCGDFQPGDLISGSYSASDNESLSGVSIAVEMAMPGSSLTKTPLAVSVDAESGTWELQTLPTTTPCGYIVRVNVADRAIVNSSNSTWWGTDVTGFCLRPPIA